MFVVVSTTIKGEETVEALATSFIVDGVLYYPKKKSDVKKSIKEMRVPDKDNWYPIPEYQIISSEFGKRLILCQT